MPTGPYHWFSGTGMVHGVELRDGRAAWYRNRWGTSEAAELLGDPDPGGPTPPIYDSSNTNVLGHGGRIYSFTEESNPYELTPELDTIGRTTFGGELPCGFTAHPKIDPVTGEMLGFVDDDATDRSDLVVLDATDVTGEPVATVHLPRRVPFGFHGSWVAD